MRLVVDSVIAVDAVANPSSALASGSLVLITSP